MIRTVRGGGGSDLLNVGEMVSTPGCACSCVCTCALRVHLGPGLWAEGKMSGPKLASWPGGCRRYDSSFWILTLCCQ